MAVELFSNLAETTLASSYTSGGTTLSVTSASGFPSTGTFRVRLNNAGKTIWRVDSVSGTTFTGAAEANDANAASSDTVILVATKAVAERFIQSPTVGDVMAVSGVGGVDRYGPMWPSKELPDLSTWTWANQGTSSFVQSGKVVALLPQSGASTNARLLYKAMPATPFTIIAGFVEHFPASTGVGANLAALGIGPYEVGTGKHIGLAMGNFDFSTGGQLQGNACYQLMTSPTAASTLYAQHKGGTNWHNRGLNRLMPPFGVYWLKYVDNGTNTSVYYSWDRITWTLLVTQSRTTGFTTAPDRVMLWMFAQAWTVTPALMGYLISWEES